jgi:inner membrane protein
MASSWTHAAGAVAIAATIVPKSVPRRVWVVVALCAVLPDVDAIGRPFGGGDVTWLGGHRALTHSLLFAATLSALVNVTVLRLASGVQAKLVLWLALTLAIASHGALDSLTSYGEGIQFLAPFTDARYWSPWRLLGGGIVRDSIVFVALYGVARTVIIRRGLPLPGALNPSFLRATV